MFIVKVLVKSSRPQRGRIRACAAVTSGQNQTPSFFKLLIHYSVFNLNLISGQMSRPARVDSANITSSNYCFSIINFSVLLIPFKFIFNK